MQKVTYKGKKYKSLTLACDLLGVHSATVRIHTKNGMTFEQAVEQILKNKKRNNCTDHLGNKFKSMVDMTEFYNIPYSTFYTRLKEKKWDLERALTTPNGKPRGKYASKVQG